MTSPVTISAEWQRILLPYPELLAVAPKVLSSSKFVCDWGGRHVELLQQQFRERSWLHVYQENDITEQLKSCLQSVNDEAGLHQQLRHFRYLQMSRIIWRDLAGWADLAETMRDLSVLADACISQSLALLHQWQVEQNGSPCDAKGHHQYMVVLGMGKLGAGELNLSSDIDLILTYPEEGETQGGNKPISNAEFFLRVGRKLIQALDNNTVDGFVFRVDMRLRPFGDSGSLVSSFAAMEDYYQTQGREWERYAMIKARAITGSEAVRQSLSNMLRPFIYRRYLDYGMFDSLREMKSMIAGQLHRKGMEDNIKLGAGGIREIEFIGQVFQLIYGGRDRPLQQRQILTILDLLTERKLLTDEAGAELKQAYDFLRRTEHRIQAWADQQLHVLPQDESARQRLAISMGFDNWLSFAEVLNLHRSQVHDHFGQLLATAQAGSDETSTGSLLNAEVVEKQDYLKKWGFQQPEESADVLENLLALNACRNLSETGRHRLERLLPLLVQAVSSMEEPDECLPRLMPLVEAIMRRSAYMSLLVENPLALTQLVKLCAASPLISHQMARYPILLDELLDPRSLYEVPEKDEQAKRLDHFLASVDADDLEQLMTRLREFRQIATLHVAAADVTGVLPLMRVGDQLTELAEIQLERVWRLAWNYLVDRHGYPPGANGDDIQHCGFTILAYGKLGGLELGYGSDLDLVFLFDDSRQEGYTDGDKPVDLMVFYTRLAQRLIHLLSTVTPGGMLYEVDSRLRPRGASGLLVCPLSGFSEYQITEAWTWEHQALVRARCVIGDQALMKKVIEVRQQVLARARNHQALAQEVSEMRSKMRSQLDKSNEQLFDLKQGRGGIADIEFMVQYAVLAWSVNLPELLVYTDNIRILDALVVSGKLDPAEGEMLAEAYRYYRNEANHCVLQERPALIPLSQLADYPRQVTQIWQRWLGEP